ncbi:MAG: sulfurtransferase TusA family protein [Clostridia bacterium]|nr:MAG: sulfurtransferase TusA family protein [Clostridia bacterium]
MPKLKAVKTGPSSYQVDMRGWMCPYPKYALEALLCKLPQDSAMALQVDCPAAITDVPAVARALGFTVEPVIQTGDGEWKIVIKNYD